MILGALIFRIFVVIPSYGLGVLDPENGDIVLL